MTPLASSVRASGGAEIERTVMAALREVNLLCALPAIGASDFFETPQAGGRVDPRRLTQVGLALKELGIQMIPACSHRRHPERNSGTWQGRLPQELRLRGIAEREAANQFLREEYRAEFNRRFRVPRLSRAVSSCPVGGGIWTPSSKTRTVARDNRPVR